MKQSIEKITKPINKMRDPNNKVQLALAAIMFFSPFVKNMINDEHVEIDKDDKDFIEWYVRFGYLTIGVLVIAMVSGISNYILDFTTLARLYKISIAILILLLIAGTVAAVSDMKLFQWDAKIIKYYDTKSKQSDILFAYIPIYNIYLWYKLHDFDHPYRWTKESIMIWSVFLAIALLTQSIVLISFVLTIIIIRVVSLMYDIDMLDPELKNRLSKLFYKNPEELWAYITWTVKFTYKKLFSKDLKSDIKKDIESEKENYNHLYKFSDNKSLYIQYTLLAIFLIWEWSLMTYKTNIWIYYVPIILILWRYLVMIIKWNHSPNIPLMKELVDLWWYMYGLWKLAYKKIKLKYKK